MFSGGELDGATVVCWMGVSERGRSFRPKCEGERCEGEVGDRVKNRKPIRSFFLALFLGFSPSFGKSVPLLLIFSSFKNIFYFFSVISESILHFEPENWVSLGVDSSSQSRKLRGATTLRAFQAFLTSNNPPQSPRC